MSCHLRNLDTHDPRYYTHHLYNHPRLQSLVCYNKEPTLNLRLSSPPRHLPNPTLRSSVAFDVWLFESAITKPCPDFISTPIHSSPVNRARSVLWTKSVGPKSFPKIRFPGDPVS